MASIITNARALVHLIKFVEIMGDMTALRCERCDLLIGAGCACPTDGSVPRDENAKPAARAAAAKPAAKTATTKTAATKTAAVKKPAAKRKKATRVLPLILISPSETAHLPKSCTDQPGGPEDKANWGWIAGPPRGLWEDIGTAGEPVWATGGNLDLAALQRCPDCDASPVTKPAAKSIAKF
jgi:hypothetical protein